MSVGTTGAFALLQTQTPWVWTGALLTSSQVVLLLLLQGLSFEQQCCGRWPYTQGLPVSGRTEVQTSRLTPQEPSAMTLGGLSSREGRGGHQLSDILAPVCFHRPPG